LKTESHTKTKIVLNVSVLKVRVRAACAGLGRELDSMLELDRHICLVINTAPVETDRKQQNIACRTIEMMIN